MTPVILIQGVILTTTAVAHYTVPAGDNRLKYVQMTSLRFCNITAGDVLVTLYVVPKGKTAATKYLRFSSLKIPANVSEDPSAYFVMNDVLLPGTMLQAFSNTAGAIAMSAFGTQYP